MGLQQVICRFQFRMEFGIAGLYLESHRFGLRPKPNPELGDRNFGSTDCLVGYGPLPTRVGFGIGRGKSGSESVTCGRIRRAGIRCLAVRRVGTTCAASVGKDHHSSSVDDQEPFLLSLFKETVWSLRSLFIFLHEQPSQLKYIEWPGSRSTLKTATLTLVLVALLIVALSSTDSALSYMLGLFLRRKP
ncbi:uncharacterized protein LOC126784389 [Argentina anserina]|uniref:uncharacterized protein LOC126784389 n=1 Tax=Argentina anserina TaxID=57926 RepID=UPI0021767311|nr:uncharacterized protein LOC126784389 [Potentilla anserina]